MTKKVTLKIQSLAPLGDGVSTADAQFYYVPGAIPGDLVEVEIAKTDKRGVHTKLLQIVEPSPHRRIPDCPLHNVCGGCSLLHADEAIQRQAKTENLARQFARQSVPFVSTGPALGYRRLARLHARRQSNGQVAVGFFGRRGNNIVEIDHCPVLEPQISSILPDLKAELFQHLNTAAIRISSGMEGVFLSIDTDTPLPPAFYNAAAAAVPRLVQGIVVEWEGISTTVAGSDTLTLQTGHKHRVVLPAGGFGQANAYINQVLTAAVNRWIEQSDAQTAIELYAGAGNFSVLFAHRLKQLTLVELDPRACNAAKQNFAATPHVRILCEDALQGYLSEGTRAELVLLDPPRTGAKELAAAMAVQSHREIVYVSCNPGTLKRDVAILQTGGYTLNELIGFDMFPQTPHLEAAARLTKK
ncbi:MAG: class I SAM-dependent RNA methyltransferase [Deltaproteobacteria bacterium]|nr:class I SAM-dependent RNA methyltransferase [Deltaproteobacteria bacterium]MBN2672911.1 class I SAM-dependent RNA methyltransferase [Deltaproteobacteria bacterium]